MWIKICANTNLEDAQLAAELGADAVGFVFAPSKRQVTVAQVAAITRHLPDTLETVGVFAVRGEEDADGIVAAVQAAGLRGVQLHGAHCAALIESVNEALEGRVRLIQLAGVAVEGDAQTAFLEKLREAGAQPQLTNVLLDAERGAQSGGLGVSFDWAAAAATLDAFGREALPKIVLAGGLDAGNVASAILAVRPWGVDVASGVEASPGRKDPVKLREFIDAARGARLP